MKKVALFLNGYNNDFLNKIVSGMKPVLDKKHIHLYIFSDFSFSAESNEFNRARMAIFNLPSMDYFDGAIIAGNTLQTEDEVNLLQDKINSCDIPVVSIDYKFKNSSLIETDNHIGIAELTRHLIKDHHVSNIVIVGGPENNEESNIRIDTIINVAGLHKVTIPKDNIIYSDFGYVDIIPVIKSYIETHEQKPDAIICANDIMALGVCNALKQMQLSVPYDIIVTGFDGCEEGKVNFPMLTTVEKNYEEVGRLAINNLCDYFDGKNQKKKMSVPSMFIKKESCGCKVTNEDRAKQLFLYKDVRSINEDNNLFETHLTVIDQTFSSVNSLTEMLSVLPQMWMVKHNIEGDNFEVYLDDPVIESFKNVVKLRTDNYGDVLYPLAVIKDGKFVNIQKMKKSDMFYNKYTDDENSHIFYITALTYNTKSVGYAVFIDNLSLSSNLKASFWTNKVADLAVKTANNILTKKNSDKYKDVTKYDAFTGMENIQGFYAQLKSSFDRSIALNRPNAFIRIKIADFDNIGSKYGDLQKDFAIKVVAESIKLHLPKGWHAALFENGIFVCYGECDFSSEYNELFIEIEKETGDMAKNNYLPYDISLCSYLWIDEPPTDQYYEDYSDMVIKKIRA